MITAQCLILSFAILGSSITVVEFVGNDPLCPSKGISYLPHYSNCSLFFECNDGFKYLMHCPEFYAFDANTDKCEVASKVDCSYTTISPPTTKPPKDPSCPATGIAYIPHYSNCTLYYMCVNGYKTLEQCDPGYGWSIPLAACDFLENVDCSYTTIVPPTTTPAKDPSCPDSGIKYFPNYADCHSFYECDDGYKSKIYCAEGYAWNPQLAACDFEERVDCSYTTINPPTTTPPNECPDEGYSYLPNYADCTKFVECRNGQEYYRKCPDGYAWSITLNQCDFADNVDCSYTTLAPVTSTTTNAPTTPDTTCPASGISYLPDYADCRVYYQCNGGIKTKEVCDDGQAWSIVLNICDDEAFVDCSYTTTTLIPPTTTPFPRDCPANGTSFIPDEYDCTSFYECREGSKITRQCPEGFAWDIDKDSCQNIDTVDCSYTKLTSSTSSAATTTPETTTAPTPTSYTTEITTPITTPTTTSTRTSTTPLTTPPTTTPSSLTTTTPITTSTSPPTSPSATTPTPPPTTSPNTTPSPPSTTPIITTTSPSISTPSMPTTTPLSTASTTPTSTAPTSTPSSLPTTTPTSPSTPPPSTPSTSTPTPSPTTTPIITTTKTTTTVTTTPSSTTTEPTVTTKKTPGTTLDPYCPYPDKVTYHVHPYNCSLYYECRDGIKYLKECEEGYLWSNVLNTCDLASDVKCDYTSVSPTGTDGLGVTPFLGAFQCRRYSDGFVLAHPYSCKKFIECKNGNDIVHVCPSGTAWDRERKYCDISTDNKCLLLSDTY